LTSPTSTRDLLPSEHHLVTALQQMGFGRFEFVRIEGGELVLDPWPTTVHYVKFGLNDTSKTLLNEFELKRQHVEFFQYVRSVEVGEIRCLEVRHGLPFSMEIEQRPNAGGGRRG
jgi:hypothetical protein